MYVVWHHVKVIHIPPGCDAYLNLDIKMIAKASIAYEKMYFKLTQEALDRVYPDYQHDTFNINNAFLYQTLSKIMDMDAHVYTKQKKSMQDS